MHVLEVTCRQPSPPALCRGVQWSWSALDDALAPAAMIASTATVRFSHAAMKRALRPYVLIASVSAPALRRAWTNVPLFRTTAHISAV